MGTTERRNEILKRLSRRRRDTISNLASEFGVSKRTIRRDIDEMSLSVPIYTQTGRNGGIHMLDGYSMERVYMNDDELGLLKKISRLAERTSGLLTAEDQTLLRSIISSYTKPNTQNHYERK